MEKDFVPQEYREKELVPFDQAMELKDLGFDVESSFIYDCYEKFELWDVDYNFYETTTNENIKNEGFENWCIAPLYQQAFRWFREKGIRFDITTSLYDIGLKYKVRIGSSDIVMNDYDTYDEAELVCLNELINIYKIMLSNKKEGV